MVNMLVEADGQVPSYGQTALTLLREVKNTTLTNFFPYNYEAVSHVSQEVSSIFEDIQRTLEEIKHSAPAASSGTYQPSNISQPSSQRAVFILYQTIRRNQQILQLYHSVRLELLRELVMELGLPDIPMEIKTACSKHEHTFLRTFSENVWTPYQTHYIDLDLRRATRRGTAGNPPKELMIVIRVMEDCGEIQTESGILSLREGDQLYVKRSDVEDLIVKGSVRHVIEDD